MSQIIENDHINPIHPFPARMTPDLVWDLLPKGKSLHILDPMVGSGTTVVSARAKGYYAYGCDTDPLALMIAKAWSSDVYTENIRALAKDVLNAAILISKTLSGDGAYPPNCDEETKTFINYWFDEENRTQLSALVISINQLSNTSERNILLCAFSRLIITKKTGVSLAMDVSHSRPHKKYITAPVKAFDQFLRAVEYIIKKAPFKNGGTNLHSVIINYGDARKLPYEDNSIDMVLTSPPYLNAIDYLRGHKLVLVWLGYSIETLRQIRSSNIGTERSINLRDNTRYIQILNQIADIDMINGSSRNMIIRYLNDMDNVLSECRRVLVDKGRAIIVIGNSSLRGAYVKNSDAMIALAEYNGFSISSQYIRSIPDSKRYLPSPGFNKSGNEFMGRMREEVVLEFNGS